ncbi:MAG: HEAT repeat domain-containing protein [Bacillota bacterium]
MLNCSETVKKLAFGLSGREELLDLLVAAQDCSGPEAARAVFAYTAHEDYLVKSRAWVSLKRMAPSSLVPELIASLANEQDLEFRLRCVEVLGSVRDQASVDQIGAFLADPDPLVVRAIVWALGEIGGEQAASSLLVFAASPAGRIIRREVVAEALATALAGLPEDKRLQWLRQKQAGSLRVWQYLQGLSLELGPMPRFSPYPAPDYFRLQCKIREIDYRTYKNIMES